MTAPAPRPNVNPMALPVLALAGRAVLTFRNVDAGTHFTVKIKQARDKRDRKIKLDHFHVSISLLGDKTQGMRYTGMLFPKENFRIWIARNVQSNEKLAIVFRWLVNAIRNPQILRGVVDQTTGRKVKVVHLFHENNCCHCGMPLTHPESIYTGIGPVCMKHLQNQFSNTDVNLTEVFAPIEANKAAVLA